MILGIDPGLSGACVLLGAHDIVVFDMPVSERVTNGKTKRQVDAAALASLLEPYRGHVRFAIVEKVGAMPRQGVTSSFNFGRTAGVIEGVLAALKIETRYVHPQVWKRHFGLLGQPKDASRGEASRRLPAYANHWPLKKHDGRAEAALLAVYGGLMDSPQNFGGTD